MLQCIIIIIIINPFYKSMVESEIETQSVPFLILYLGVLLLLPPYFVVSNFKGTATESSSDRKCLRFVRLTDIRALHAG